MKITSLIMLIYMREKIALDNDTILKFKQVMYIEQRYKPLALHGSRSQKGSAGTVQRAGFSHH